MNDWFLKNRHKDQNIVLVGDLNIAPLEHDVWSSKALRQVVSHTAIEREKLNRNMNEFGFIDAPRLVFPETDKLYSWWSYRNLDWEKSDRGRRLDHIWITPNLAKKTISSYIVKNMRKSQGPSDHVPVVVNIS
jgi:exodeoxyribonuclease-3